MATHILLSRGVAVLSRVVRDEDANRLMRHVQDDARQRQVKHQVGNVRRPQPYVADTSVFIPAVVAVPVPPIQRLALDLERELPAAGNLSLHVATQPDAGRPDLFFDGPWEDMVLLSGPVHDELLAVEMLSGFPMPSQAVRGFPLFVAEMNAPLLGLYENDRNIAAVLLQSMHTMSWEP